MANYLVDTDVLIDYFKGRSWAMGVMSALAEQGNVLGLCCVNLAEFHAGIPEDQRERVQAALDRLAYFDISPDAAKQAGEFRYRYARTGIAVSTQDALVAAASVENDAYVITRNRSDYPMPEVRLFDPSPRP